jgi:hypothetical protein
VNGPAIGTFSISQPRDTTRRFAGTTTSKSPAGRNTFSKSSLCSNSPVGRLTDGVDALSQPNPDNRTTLFRPCWISWYSNLITSHLVLNTWTAKSSEAQSGEP